MTLSQALDLALERHQAGRLAEAEALYRQILAAQPDHADALQYLGVIAHQAGRYDLALEWIRQAVALNPNSSSAQSNLGEACRALGRLDEAIAAYRRALEIQPDLPEAHNNLGNALRQRGRLDEAAAACRRALELKPDYPEAHNNLGLALNQMGQLDESMAAYRRALELKPDYPEACNNLGAALAARDQFDEAIASYRRALQLRANHPEALYNLGAALQQRGQLDEAVAAYRHALALKPDYPEAHNNLGAVLAGQGQFDQAMALYRRALQLQPDSPEAHFNLANALRETGRFDEAIVAYRSALALRPDHPQAHNNLGAALNQRGQLDAAIASYRRALQLQSDNPEPCNNLGNALKDQGELDEAMAAFRRALALKPDYAPAHSNLVLTLHYHPGHDVRAISKEHQRWNRQFSDPLKPFVRPHENDRSQGRRLRVGYVSPDFREHPVGRCALPLFERHDREQFEILCYSGVARPDAMTERFRALASAWRNMGGVSDARLAEMIREDRVDILVDLAMHTADNRLPAFARRPAPVQVTWLAYPGSTGLPSIGYRLTDVHMDPPGERTAWSAEEPVRLPDCWCCYDPMGASPEINALPASAANGVTFGALNSFPKINHRVLELWARVLHAVKGSRILMLCPEGSARERVQAFFGAREISAQRVELGGRLPRWEYLRLYQRIDIGLDPFPCNGMTTTCDALWMGVPVLTLPGEMPVSRAGLSLLSTVGLADLAASSEEDYVRIAAELAENLPRLAELRATLRARMQASPLMDAPRFARNVEAAYRQMWERWCSGQSAIREI